MSPPSIHIFKQKALQFASSFEVFCCLDSNNYKDQYSKYDCLIAFGKTQELNVSYGDAFAQLKSFYEAQKDWMFGLLSYELKNEIEDLKTNHTDKLNFPDLYFFVPEYLIAIQGDEIHLLKGNQAVLNTINDTELLDELHNQKVKIEHRFTKSEYIETVQKLQNQIKRGDIYEVNFCQEFFAENAEINPLAIFQELNQLSPTPFAGFFKIYDKYILSATPERFLCKRGNRLISQHSKPSVLLLQYSHFLVVAVLVAQKALVS